MKPHIDLHMHSSASDGTDTPAGLMERVKAASLCVFALTDHDTAVGVRLRRKGSNPDHKRQRISFFIAHRHSPLKSRISEGFSFPKFLAALFFPVRTDNITAEPSTPKRYFFE